MTKKIRQGDIIRLELFTELTHTLNEGMNVPHKPVVYLTILLQVDYHPIPPLTSIHEPLECNPEAIGLTWQKSTTTSVSSEPVDCKGCFCSLYGIRMLLCVFKTNPIAKINLQTLKDECWFTDKEVSDMSNSKISAACDTGGLRQLFTPYVEARNLLLYLNVWCLL